MIIKDVMKLVGRKYPVCTVIDASAFQEVDITEKCQQKPKVISVGKGDKYKVTVCTGSFNVYVLQIEETNAE